MGSTETSIMQTFTLVLSLLVLFVHQGQTKVSSCLTCMSTSMAQNADCEAGNENASKMACQSGMPSDGCSATVTVAGGVTAWARGCCGTVMGMDTCQEVHTDVVGSTDTVSCTTDNCNTMDPRNSGSSAGTLLPSLLLPVIIMVSVM